MKEKEFLGLVFGCWNLVPTSIFCDIKLQGIDPASLFLDVKTISTFSPSERSPHPSRQNNSWVAFSMARSVRWPWARTYSIPWTIPDTSTSVNNLSVIRSWDASPYSIKPNWTLNPKVSVILTTKRDTNNFSIWNCSGVTPEELSNKIPISIPLLVVVGTGEISVVVGGMAKQRKMTIKKHNQLLLVIIKTFIMVIGFSALLFLIYSTKNVSKTESN